MEDIAKQEQKKEAAKCPCCGSTTEKTTVKVSDQVMDHFLACLYTGQAFWRDYEVYDGRVRIRSVIPDSNKTSLLLDVLKRLQVGAGSSVTEQQLTELQFGLRCMLATAQIQISSPDPEHTLASVTRPSTVCTQLLEGCRKALASGGVFDASQWCQKLLYTLQDPGQCTAVPLALLISVHQVHRTVYNTIMNAGFGENFWHGIELT